MLSVHRSLCHNIQYPYRRPRDFGIEIEGERAVRNIPIRTHALLASNPEHPDQRFDIATFDAASAGGALLLGNLPERALDMILSALAS